MHSTRLQSKETFLVLVVILITAYLYFPVHAFGFVWDDKELIVNDHRLQSGILTWEALSRPVLEKTTYFRPLVFLTYFYEIKLFGLDPKVFHAVNILIFLCNVVLAYFLSQEILGRLKCEKLAWLVCLLYAVHPTLVEANAWISGRFDLLATTFIFAALLTFFKRSQASRYSDFFIAFFTFLGLLSKESAIVVPGLIFLCYMATRSEKGGLKKFRLFFKENKFLIFYQFVVIGLYFYLRTTSMGAVYHFDGAMEANEGRSIFLPLYTLAFYFHQILMPFFEINPQHEIALEMAKSYQNPLVYLLTIAFGIGMVALALKNKAAGWLGLAAIFSLSLTLNIIPMTIGGNIGHERFLTTPLFFFLALLVYVGHIVYIRLPPRPVKRIVAAMLIGVFFVGCLFTTKSVIPIWRSNYTLWSWMYKKTPEIDYVSAAYFLTLLSDKRFDEFESEFQKIMKSGGGLSPMQKVFYSTYLLEKRDPSSVEKIEAAIAAIKINVNRKENNVAASLKASQGLLYFLYFDKALALATIDGDVKGAVEASLQADQWKPQANSPNFESLWSRLAYYYLLQDYANTKLLYEQIKSVRIIGGKDLTHAYLDVVYRYCKSFDLKSEPACENKALQSLREISQ